MARALVVEDDPEARDALCEWVEAQGFDTHGACSLAEAREALAAQRFDVALLDLDLPDGSGLDLLGDLDRQPAIDVAFITGHSSVDSAVEAFRRGAVDYLTKPVDLKRLRGVLAQTLRALGLRAEIGELRGELRRLGRVGELIGASTVMQQVYDLIERVAPTDATVLVTGETGTGKEVVARTIHDLSPRARKPFVPVNCGALPPSLIESELFGHEKGSFTGADRRHRGVFERAHEGTLFLDEIGDMPLDLQVRLLRVLETQQVQPVGSDRAVDVDVRVVAATNRDPHAAVRDGRLREDLLYRLLVFPIDLPPLRDRGDDVLLLADHFLAAAGRTAGSTKRLSPAAREHLRRHAWPGNVRELRHLLQRAAILVRGDEIGPDAMQLVVPALETGAGSVPPAASGAAVPPVVPRAATASAGVACPVAPGTTIAEMERWLVLATLEEVGGNKREAARRLGISVKTLYNRLHEYGVPVGSGVPD